MFTITDIGQILWTGLATSTYFVLFSVAFALVLKVNRIFNFAQAGLMGIAFYASYWAVQMLGLWVWIGVPIGLAITLGATFVLEHYGFRTLRRRKSSAMTFFIFTLVVAEFVAYVLMLVFGTFPQTLLDQIFWPATMVFGIAVSEWDVPALLITAGVLLLLYLGMRFTSQGRFMTAVADNPELAELYGINKNRVFMWALMAGTVVAFVGMCLYGTRAQVHPSTPLELMLFAVVATILGGIGNVFGAAVAALVVNLIQKMSIVAIPSEWEGVLLYGFLFFAIIFFPNGFRLPRRRIRFQTTTRELAVDKGAGGDAAN